MTLTPIKALAPIKLAAFEDRAAIGTHIKQLCPYLDENDVAMSDVRGSKAQALARLNDIDPLGYAQSRNHIDGKVTNLSPFIRHGLIDLVQMRDHVNSLVSVQSAETLLQQMTWREYWHRLYRAQPSQIWTDVEAYKTGFSADDYSVILPDDIARGQTGTACIDAFIRQLLDQGTMHNHARLYVAAYICHWRRVKWQAGAKFFLSHLLDGDVASNNYSWQWVASTFSQKPYYFNLENVRKFSPSHIDTSKGNNSVLAGSYDELYAQLFPNLPARD